MTVFGCADGPVCARARDEAPGKPKAATPPARKWRRLTVTGAGGQHEHGGRKRRAAVFMQVPRPCPLPSWDYYRFRSPRHGNLASRPRIILARRTLSQEVVMAARDRYRHDSIDDPNAPIEPVPQPDPMLAPGRASVLQECIIAIALVAIVTLVFYGLNHGSPEIYEIAGTQTSSAPHAATQAQQTNGQAPQEAPKQAQPKVPPPAGQGTR